MAQPVPRRGPDLPYSIIAGVTPCGPNWLVASAKVHGTVFALEDATLAESFVEVLDRRPGFAVIALNAPIGYLPASRHGGRTCDRQARTLLGRRGSSIASAPIRIERGKDIDLAPDATDAVTRSLLPRYREVAVEMAPYRQRDVYEVHADLSFYQLNNEQPLRWSKHSERGIAERRSLLEQKIPYVERILDAELPGASLSHLLDVTAFLWTARRIFAHAALRIPEDPEWDEQGLRMEMFR